MPLRTVTRVRKLAEKLAGHSRRHGVRVATSATALCRERMPEDQPFVDLHTLQAHLGESLQELDDELVRVDDRHAQTLQSVRNLRELRDRAVSELRELLLQLKKTADGYYGPGGSHKIFNEAPTVPSDPVALHQLAERIHQNLTGPDFDLPEPVQDGVLVSPKVMASGFAEPRIRLGQVLTWLDDSESESKHTQSLKDDVFERLEVWTGKVARFFEALYHLAGHDRLARRLRRSSHRSADGEPDGDDGGDGEDDRPDAGPGEGAGTETPTDDEPAEPGAGPDER